MARWCSGAAVQRLGGAAAQGDGGAASKGERKQGSCGGGEKGGEAGGAEQWPAGPTAGFGFFFLWCGGETEGRGETEGEEGSASGLRVLKGFGPPVCVAPHLSHGPPVTVAPH